MEAGVVSIC